MTAQFIMEIWRKHHPSKLTVYPSCLRFLRYKQRLSHAIHWGHVFLDFLMTGNSEIIQKKGRTCSALNVLGHKFLALAEETCGPGNEWWGKSGGLEFSKASSLLSGVMNWDRGQRALLHRCEGHQYPVMCKQNQQVAEHYCIHTTTGSAGGLGPGHLALYPFLLCLFCSACYWYW